MERSGAVHRCVLWMGFLGLCSGCCVSLFGGDGVSLDLGSEEGRPQHCFSAFEVTCLVAVLSLLSWSDLLFKSTSMPCSVISCS